MSILWLFCTSMLINDILSASLTFTIAHIDQIGDMLTYLKQSKGVRQYETYDRRRLMNFVRTRDYFSHIQRTLTMERHLVSWSDLTLQVVIVKQHRNQGQHCILCLESCSALSMFGSLPYAVYLRQSQEAGETRDEGRDENSAYRCFQTFILLSVDRNREAFSMPMAYKHWRIDMPVRIPPLHRFTSSLV